MALKAITNFPISGYGLIDGNHINKLVAAVNGFLGFGGSNPSTINPITVKAAGATQGNATQIPGGALWAFVSVTASTEGVKLPSASTGATIWVFANQTVGNKVYPFLADVIGSAATNAAFALVKNTATLFVAQDSVRWRVAKGS